MQSADAGDPKLLSTAKNTVNSRFSDSQFSEKPRFSQQFGYNYQIVVYEVKTHSN